LRDDSIEAVYIPLPNHLHLEWAIKAIKAGKHVLCEKPLAGRAADGVKMFSAAEEQHVALMEGFMYRFHAQTKRVEELLGEGAVGFLRFIRVAHSFPLILEERKSDFRWRKEFAGGSLADLGVYCVDTARHFFSADPVKVFAQSLYHPDHSAEAETRAILAFPDDRVALFDSSFLLLRRREYELVGDRGRITAFETYNPDRGEEVTIEIERGGKKTVEKISSDNEYLLEIDHLSRSILQGKRPLISSNESIGNLQVMDALRQSADRGVCVEVEIAE
jgi:predicted dehydrogenase